MTCWPAARRCWPAPLDPSGSGRRLRVGASSRLRTRPHVTAGVVGRGRPMARGTSKGSKAQEGEGAHRRQRRGCYRTRSRSKALKVRVARARGRGGRPGNGPRAVGAGARRNARRAAGRGDAARLRPRELLRGVERVAGNANVGTGGSFGIRVEPAEQETRRTPGSAAGCNKPATSLAEEAVEVVRNHEDGTGRRGWSPRRRSRSTRAETRGAVGGSGRREARRWRGGGPEPRERWPDESQGRRSETIRADQGR
jgi:hypothetical protein